MIVGIVTIFSIFSFLTAFVVVATLVLKISGLIPVRNKYMICIDTGIWTVPYLNHQMNDAVT